MIEISPLIHITKELSGRWKIPIITQLEKSGGRFTPLLHKLQISPARLSENLKALMDGHYINSISANERTHPLFPEYYLTEKGKVLMEAASVIMESEQNLNKGFLAAKKWTWPMLLALSQNYQQFNEIKKVLKVATPRIISTRLSELEHIQLVEKSWIQGESIKPIYILEANQSPIIHQAKEQLLKII
ncbi:winged helix-turn-helix transcriptional regulator [Alkalihalobacillus pseudalcaliphilus]|uniref:winged helix-turn-helix transcriptional regulator n=1 Tax=Alkalihalobacillus pseudalcaliphilus TaxID=79884 RepID=UPI00064DB05C|nr:winged helix-turn-helix transcriptional regulator [Alkalihalobacillus pseudalcaliphilus]KMK75826.1 hypothetical protein AB990_11215 [Alkalihalobacillus pseudalcaliphilus]